MIDYLIMLLSTDWFLPHWEEIGIETTEAKKAGIQQGCREILDQIVDGADSFFLSDFSEEREQETNSRFLALLRTWDAEPEVSATWKEWANLSHNELTAVVVCALLNREVSSADATGSTPDLDLAIRAEVIEAWGKHALKASAFHAICLNSETEWDIRTQHLLSSPKTLANQLWRVVLDRRLRAFWANLSERLTPGQIQQLVSWYRLRAKSTCGEDRPHPIPSYIS